MRPVLAPLALALSLGACSTFQGARQLDEMSESGYAAYVERTAAQVRLVAHAAVAAGDMTPENLTTIAAALDGLASGTTAGVGVALADWLDVDSYGAVAFSLAIIELDAKLHEYGGYSEDGVIGERAKGVIQSVAKELAAEAKGESVEGDGAEG